MTDYAITTTPPTESPEQLARDPYLAILPSGDAISLWHIRDSGLLRKGDRRIKHDGPKVGDFVISYFGEDSYVFIEDPADIAAAQSAIARVGVTVYPPATAGADADGDGKAGES